MSKNYILFDTVREALNAAYDYFTAHPEVKEDRISMSMRSENRVGDYIFILNTKEHLMGRKGKFFRYNFTTHEPVEMVVAPYYTVPDISDRTIVNSGIRTDHVIRSDP